MSEQQQQKPSGAPPVAYVSPPPNTVLIPSSAPPPAGYLYGPPAPGVAPPSQFPNYVIPSERPFHPYGPPGYMPSGGDPNSSDKLRNNPYVSPAFAGNSAPVGVPVEGRPRHSGLYRERFQIQTTNAHEPTVVSCPVCGYQGVTIVHYKAGTTTYTIMVVLCCLFWPLMCIPLCVPGCQDAIHRCPNCMSLIAISPACYE